MHIEQLTLLLPPGPPQAPLALSIHHSPPLRYSFQGFSSLFSVFFVCFTVFSLFFISLHVTVDTPISPCNATTRVNLCPWTSQHMPPYLVLYSGNCHRDRRSLSQKIFDNIIVLTLKRSKKIFPDFQNLKFSSYSLYNIVFSAHFNITIHCHSPLESVH